MGPAYANEIARLSRQEIKELSDDSVEGVEDEHNKPDILSSIVRV